MNMIQIGELNQTYSAQVQNLSRIIFQMDTYDEENTKHKKSMLSNKMATETNTVIQLLY